MENSVISSSVWSKHSSPKDAKRKGNRFLHPVSNFLLVILVSKYDPEVLSEPFPQHVIINPSLYYTNIAMNFSQSLNSFLDSEKKEENEDEQCNVFPHTFFMCFDLSKMIHIYR